LAPAPKCYSTARVGAGNTRPYARGTVIRRPLSHDCCKGKKYEITFETVKASNLSDGRHDRRRLSCRGIAYCALARGRNRLLEVRYGGRNGCARAEFHTDAARRGDDRFHPFR